MLVEERLASQDDFLQEIASGQRQASPELCKQGEDGFSLTDAAAREVLREDVSPSDSRGSSRRAKASDSGEGKASISAAP